MVISEPLLLEAFIAIATFNGETSTEVSFKAGDHIEVVEKNEIGKYSALLSASECNAININISKYTHHS